MEGNGFRGSVSPGEESRIRSEDFRKLHKIIIVAMSFELWDSSLPMAQGTEQIPIR